MQLAQPGSGGRVVGRAEPDEAAHGAVAAVEERPRKDAGGAGLERAGHVLPLLRPGPRPRRRLQHEVRAG